MGTLMDKLNATNATKEQIRQAIERKKVSVPTNTPLKDYPAKIDAIYPDALFLKDSKICRSDSFSVLENVIYANGIYVSNGDVSHVDNGREFYVGNEHDGWSRHSVESKDNKRPTIVYGNGVFVTAYTSYSDNKQVVAQTSTDGINWSQHNVFKVASNYCNGVLPIVFNGSEFVVAFSDSDKDHYFFKSTDGKTWTQIGSYVSINNNTYYSFFYCDKSRTYFVLTDRSVYRSTNLTRWSSSGPFNSTNVYVNRIAKVINGIAFITAEASSGYATNVYYYDESQSWKKLDSPYGYKFLGGTYKNGQYILIFQAYNSNLDSSRYSYFTVFVNNLSEVGTATKYWFGIGGSLSEENENRFGDCVSFANNTFFMHCGGGDVSLFSHDGVSWFDNIDKIVIDTSDNDVTYETLIKMNGISAAVLQAAYDAGVNSI